MKRIVEFVWGWAITLRVMIFERDTYRMLRDYEFAREDFTEVDGPDDDLAEMIRSLDPEQRRLYLDALERS